MIAVMHDFPMDEVFLAKLPRLGRPIRVSGFRGAMAFVNRWGICEKDPAVLRLQRRFKSVSTHDAAAGAVADLRSLLEERGLLLAAGKRMGD